MKHHVCALLFFVNFLCAIDKHIGRFSYEEIFDENLAEEVLKHSPLAVKKCVKSMLYPSEDDDYEGIHQLLLLGKERSVSVAIAKSIALRCGYDYYVIEGSVLLQEHCKGTQMFVHEITSIVKRKKPIALIITELPEIIEHSGLLASMMWTLMSKYAWDSDVFLIGTSRLQKERLSQQVNERFGDAIISLELNKSSQKCIEKMIAKAGWIEKYKIPCLVAAGFVGCTFAAGYLCVQILGAIQVVQQLGNERELLKQKINDVSNEINIMMETNSRQGQLFENQLYDMQQQLNVLKEEEMRLRQQSYRESISQQEATKDEEDDEEDPISVNYWGDEDEEDFK
jgi:hypothetical protein